MRAEFCCATFMETRKFVFVISILYGTDEFLEEYHCVMLGIQNQSYKTSSKAETYKKKKLKHFIENCNLRIKLMVTDGR